MEKYDAIIIGAGVCGIYQAYKLSQMKMNFLLLEQGSDLGGTWFWNRYPGCRFDSESETYGYSFSKELLEEWDWKEHYAPREETESYLNFVASKFNLRKFMRFNSELSSAIWQEKDKCWKIRTKDGSIFLTKYLLTAIGLLSCPTPPKFKGLQNFKGTSFHTYNAPEKQINYSGKRVAVVGTGATGVQVICAIAKDVKNLVIFQRRPNWCAPLHNSIISKSKMANIKKNYDAIFEKCRNTPSGFYHNFDPRKTFEVSEKKREQFWENLYASPGFGIWLGNFKDTLSDEKANLEFSNFVAKKIRQRVKSPETAELLIPKDHGFGTRRVPMENGYYEVFNQNNVQLINLEENPIVEVTKTGILTKKEEYNFDIIIYATGFDAVTGSFDRIEFIGKDGVSLREKWENGPRTVYGLAVPKFPNLLTLAGPQSGSVATNFPRGIEEAVNWSTDFLMFLEKNKISYFDAKIEAEELWNDHVTEMSEKILFAKEKSWFTGYNVNVDKKYKGKCLIYAGGQIRFREFITNEKTQQYPSFDKFTTDQDFLEHSGEVTATI